MRSGTLFFNGTLFRKHFFRFWPIWAMNLVFWFIALPCQGLLELERVARIPESEAMIRFSRNTVASLSGGAITVAIGIVGGLLAAMAACSHLYSTRSANFMAKLPVRREGLFLSHYLSGLAMIVLPNLVNFLITVLIETAGGTLMLKGLWFWLVVTTAMEFFFYSFAVCVGMFAGHLIAQAAFFGIFNVVAVVMLTIVEGMMSEFYYGFNSFPREYHNAIAWLTPGSKLASVDSYLNYGFKLNNGPVLLAYTLVGVLLTVCALLLYRCRHLETAGDVVSVKVMRPVFKYAVSVCGGLTLGTLTGVFLDDNELVMMAAMVIWAVIACFVAQMLLDKTFRVFRKWKGAAVVAALFVLTFAVILTDATGFEKRVPQAGDVASVRVEGLNMQPGDSGSFLDVTLDDPEHIAAVVVLHQSVLKERETEQGEGVATYTNLTLTYYLKSGAMMNRSYTLRMENTDHPAAGSIADLAMKLHNDRDVVCKSFRLDEIQTAVEEKPNLRLTVDSGDGWSDDPRMVELWDAVVRDIREGNLGVYSFERENELRYLGFEWHEMGVNEGAAYETNMMVRLAPTAVRTLEKLEELEGLGLFSGFDSAAEGLYD